MKIAVVTSLCLSCLCARADWKVFSPREEIAPMCEMRPGRHGSNALHVSSGGNTAAFGGWRHEFTDIAGGESYCFTAWDCAENVEVSPRAPIARPGRVGAGGKGPGPPGFSVECAGRK